MSMQTPDELNVLPAKRARISLIWLVPLFALGISLFIAWQAISSRGPSIEISFTNGEGVEAGKTVLKYREVEVGTVESVRFGDDLQNVLVSVRVDKSIAPYINTDAKFWIVRPEVSARGITGLATVLGGVYLEGVWDDQPGPLATSFVGLDEKPLITGAEKGVEFVLSAPEANRVQAGAPIVFKGVTVGFIDAPQLTADGSAVTAKAFVKAPHDKLVTTATRFWGTSGFSVNLGPQGLSVDVANLSALLQGGISFSSFGYHAPAVKSGQVFTVHKDQAEAKNASFEADSKSDVALTVLFSGSISGLSVGAHVEFKGLQVGTVVEMEPLVEKEDGRDIVRMRTDLSVQPSRLGLADDATADDVAELFTSLVAQGYRARLTSQGILGTTLRVDIVQVPDALPASLELTDEGTIILPTTAPSLSDIAETAKGALQRLDDLPIEEFVQSAVDLVQNLNKVASSPQIQEAPQELVGLLKQARDLIASESVQGLAGEADQTIASVRAVVDRFEQSEALTNLLAALARSDAIAKSIETTAAGLPQLMKDIEAVANKARDLPLDQLMSSATNLVDSAEKIVASEQVAALPAQLASTMNDLSVAVGNVREVTDRIGEGEAMNSLIAALDRTGNIAKSIDETTAGLPALLAKIDAVVAKADALPLDQLVASASDLVSSADALVASDATKKIPAQLSANLDELKVVLDNAGKISGSLSQDEALSSLTAALARTDTIAKSVETASAGLPDLVAKIDKLATTASGLPLNELIDSADELVKSANTLVSSPDTAKIPASLSYALDEVGAALADLRAGGAVENTNATLASAREAAAAVEKAAASLPELTARLEGLVTQGEALLTTYGGRSQFNAQALSLLSDLRATARSVTALARAIERKPNSLLIGR